MYLCIHQGRLFVSSADPKSLRASGIDHFEPIEYEPAAERAVALRSRQEELLRTYKGPIKYATPAQARAAALAELLAQIED